MLFLLQKNKTDKNLFTSLKLPVCFFCHFSTLKRGDVFLASKTKSELCCCGEKLRNQPDENCIKREKEVDLKG